MSTNSYGNDSSSQNSAIYVKKKGINELFEAMMTALMIHKPDDHLTFIRQCLDKVKMNQNDIRWDFFVSKSSSSRRFHRRQQKPLPPIAHTKPIIFILSSSGSMKLSSRLLERYHQINYLSINDIADIDDDEPINLNHHEYRYECIQNTIEQRLSQADGFLIAGELDEQNFLKQWQETLGRIDLVFILSFKIHSIIINQDFSIIQIDLNDDFENILSCTIDHLDRLFPRDAFLSQRSLTISIPTNHFKHSIIFCIDDENKNNSFLSTLCQRLAEQLSFKYIHYANFDQTFWNFEKLKSEIHGYPGYIINHFPRSFDDLHRFQSEIGPCSVLIHIDDHRMTTKSNEINRIIERFQKNKKAISVDYRMEADEDFKSELLKYL